MRLSAKTVTADSVSGSFGNTIYGITYVKVLLILPWITACIYILQNCMKNIMLEIRFFGLRIQPFDIGCFLVKYI